MDSLEKLKYPIGPFKAQDVYTYEDIRSFIKTLEKFPKNLKKLLKKLSKQQLNTAYRPGGWTVKQVIHHLADSHLNAYIRMKLAVTETTPVVKAYEEALWAETADGKDLSPKVSLNLLKALHERWVHFLNSLQLEDLETGYFHPEKQRIIPLPEAIALYAWHAKHHLAHIKLVLEGATSAQEQEQEKPETSRESVVDTPKAAPKQRGRKATAKATEAATLKRAGRSKKEATETTTAPKRPGRPKATAAGATPKKAGRPKKATTQTTEAPKRTRAEILELARAARAAKIAAGEQPAAPKKAGRPKKAAKTTEGAKLTRAEILEKARAARAAKAEARKTSPKGNVEQMAPPATPKKAGRPKSKYPEKETGAPTARAVIKRRSASPAPATPKSTTRKTKKQ